MDLSVIKVGDVFANPGGGESVIISVNEKNIWYKRKKSKISLPIEVFFAVCSIFAGKKCSTADLKVFNPGVFSSKDNGHTCNCTFLFLIAEKMQLITDGIHGKGVRGEAFFVLFK